MTLNKNVKLTQDSTELAELKGQIVDILEDALADTDAGIPNEDRDEAIEDGDDPEETAIIYGEDYDTIADIVEDIVLSEDLQENPAQPEKQKEIVGRIMEAYGEIAAKAEFPNDDLADGGFMDSSRDGLEDSIRKTFTNWKLFA